MLLHYVEVLKYKKKNEWRKKADVENLKMGFELNKKATIIKKNMLKRDEVVKRLSRPIRSNNNNKNS